MVKILVWNVRGLNKTSKHNLIASYIVANNVSLCCFLETKMTTANFNNYVLNKWPGWVCETNFNKINGGRMALMWNPNVLNCVFNAVETQYMHLKCVCRISQISFLATLVYPLYTALERKALWEELAILGDG
ncbi:unnamed protein product, partial [Cuscuta epithymum]